MLASACQLASHSARGWAVAPGVAVAVGVFVATGVAVGVSVGVSVAVAVGVGLGVALPVTSMRTLSSRKSLTHRCVGFHFK